jgi:hypothetical protein
VAGERQFEPAAERGAVDRGEDRLRSRLDLGEEVGQPRRERRAAEFGEIGARRKGAPPGDDDHGLDAVIGQRAGEPGLEPRPDRVRERIDRRVVDREDRHALLHPVMHPVAHLAPTTAGPAA